MSLGCNLAEGNAGFADIDPTPLIPQTVLRRLGQVFLLEPVLADAPAADSMTSPLHRDCGTGDHRMNVETVL